MKGAAREKGVRGALVGTTKKSRGVPDLKNEGFSNRQRGMETKNVRPGGGGGGYRLFLAGLCGKKKKPGCSGEKIKK